MYNLIFHNIPGEPKVSDYFKSEVSYELIVTYAQFFFHVKAQFMEIYVVYGSMSFEMARWTREQKAKVVHFYLKSGSPVTAQRQFRAFFGARETPDRRTIIRLAESFIAQGSVEERGRAGRARTALTPEKINEIADSVKEKPSISVRRLANEAKIAALLHDRF